jgi:AcrR family transcriptional regulator
MSMPSTIHPTKAKLIEATSKLLKTVDRAHLTSDMILEESGISKGSLYHHFEDLDELIEAALIQRYARWVDASIELMTQLLTSAASSDDIYSGLTGITRRTQSDEFRAERQNRIDVLSRAGSSKRFAKLLGEEQQRLTDALTDLIREAQERGFYKKEVDARAIAVFIQAYTVGKIVDDFNENKVDPEEWVNLINLVIKMVFIK